MRVLYVGNCDSLAREIVNSLRKEDNDIYVLSEKAFAPKLKPTLKYKEYICSGSYADAEKYFVNIKPDIVIFAGNLYLKEKWEQDELAGQYLQQLLNILNFASVNSVSKFILMSSSHVLDGRRIGRR